MKKSTLSYLLFFIVFTSSAQQQLNRKDFYGTWELSAVNAVVLNDLEKELGQTSMQTIYFEFKKKKRYSFYREGIATRGTFQVVFSSMGTNTLLLTDAKGELQRLLVTYKKQKGERFLVFTETKKRDGDTADKQIVTSFIKIKDCDIKVFQKKVDKEMKLLLEDENK